MQMRAGVRVSILIYTLFPVHCAGLAKKSHANKPDRCVFIMRSPGCAGCVHLIAIRRGANLTKFDGVRVFVFMCVCVGCEFV